MRNYVKLYIYSCPQHILTPNQFFDIPFIPVLRLIPTILPFFSNFTGAGVGKVVVVEVVDGGFGGGWGTWQGGFRQGRGCGLGFGFGFGWGWGCGWG